MKRGRAGPSQRTARCPADELITKMRERDYKDSRNKFIKVATTTGTACAIPGTRACTAQRTTRKRMRACAVVFARRCNDDEVFYLFTLVYTSVLFINYVQFLLINPPKKDALAILADGST